jgi:aspartate/tyrosine/aromatic aminotransferase
MFETITPAPPDAILGLTDAFKKDSNPKKINLGVGVYKDAQGRTPVLPSVKEAERRIDATENTKSYLPIEGSPEYAAATQEMVLGAGSSLIAGGRAVTVQAPGGTGALRVGAEFVKRFLPNATVWVSNPTWPNHPSVFESAGLKVGTYPYFDATNNRVDIDAMLAKVQTLPAGDVLLLHGCCHNPTGADLSLDQWQQIAVICQERGLLPLLDFAYQGFADGLEEDAAGVRLVAEACPESLIASSYSKNFGLYNERVGALTLIAKDSAAAEAALSHIKQVVRANYSNPPAHGAKVVETILTDPALRKQWEAEVTDMRQRINRMRDLFVETLNEKGVDRDFSFIARQRGMFSFSGLTPEHVKKLRDQFGVYAVGSGRINVAGMTEGNMEYLCEAIAAVLRDQP